MPQQPSDKKQKQLIEYLQTFQEETIFTQKDFEKKCPIKAPSQVLKEMLDSVMCDYPFLLDLCKCGIINVYYIYPNETKRHIIRECSNLEAKIVKTEEEILCMKKSLEMAQRERKQFKGKNELMVEHSKLIKDKNGLGSQILKLEKGKLYWDSDKKKFEKDNIINLRKNLEIITENIDILLNFLSKKYNIDEQVLKKELEIPLEFKDV